MATLNKHSRTPNATTADHPIVGNRVIAGEGTSAATWQAWQGLKDLPAMSIARRFPRHQRVCIFAPHPDDEIAGCAGLMQQLAVQGNPIALINVTNGTQSHPDSTIFPPQKLNQIRPLESQLALTTLGIAAQVEMIALDLPDGALYSHQDELYARLTHLLRPDDILVTTFAHDGHPDHEATGQVVQRFANVNNLSCYQVLIWAWHWAVPDDSRIAWHRAERLDLSAFERQLKQQALQCFSSQIYPDPSTGNAAILPDYAIARMTLPWEVYLHDG